MIVSPPQILDEEWCSGSSVIPEDATDLFDLGKVMNLMRDAFMDALLGPGPHSRPSDVWSWRYRQLPIPLELPVNYSVIAAGLEALKAQSEALSRVAAVQATQTVVALNMPIPVRRCTGGAYRHFCRITGAGYDGPACPPPYALDHDYARSAAFVGSATDNAYRGKIECKAISISGSASSGN